MSTLVAIEMVATVGAISAGSPCHRTIARLTPSSLKLSSIDSATSATAKVPNACGPSKRARTMPIPSVPSLATALLMKLQPRAWVARLSSEPELARGNRMLLARLPPWRLLLADERARATVAWLAASRITDTTWSCSPSVISWNSGRISESCDICSVTGSGAHGQSAYAGSRCAAMMPRLAETPALASSVSSSSRLMGKPGGSKTQKDW